MRLIPTILVAMLTAFVVALSVSNDVGKRLGASISTTSTSDTLETFRTNVNSSLTNINNVLGATTTSNSWAGTQTFINAVLPYASSTAIDLTGYLKLGTNGSTNVEMKATTCNFLGMDASHTASTTKPYDCAVTGLASGDALFALLATSSPAVGQSDIFWAIRSCHASTTANYATCDIYNGTGATAVPSVSAVGSSTNIWYVDY